MVARLLSTPTLSAEELRARGVDPGTADLIHVANPDRDGIEQYPAFQFDAKEIRPVVTRVNRILGAAEDPLGVWDWWASGHSYLEGGVAPATLLGDPVQEELVVVLAKSVGQDT